MLQIISIYTETNSSHHIHTHIHTLQKQVQNQQIKLQNYPISNAHQITQFKKNTHLHYKPSKRTNIVVLLFCKSSNTLPTC